MLLVFDIGNTNIVAGVFEGDDLRCEVRVKTDVGKTSDEYRAIVSQLIRDKLGEGKNFQKSIISSVVPTLTPLFVELVREGFAIEPLVVGPGIKTGMQIRLSEPSTVGADRVVNAVAAKKMFGAPVLVVDFGTATSFDVVSAEGHYEGGVIAPGLMVSLDALVRRTAQLPAIELSWPKSVIGKSTVQAMQAGAVVGYVCMVDGLITRLKEEMKGCNSIIATGGLGGIISQHSNEITGYERHLTLHGLKIIAEMNG